MVSLGSINIDFAYQSCLQNLMKLAIPDSRWLFRWAMICLWGIALAINWPVSGVAQDSVPDRTRPRPDSFQRPYLIRFDGEINSRLEMFFNRRMNQAEAAGADLLIIQIDSPGGLKFISLEMARRLRNCQSAYTVAIIENEAISGAALVSLGVDEVQVNPDAKFGDAGEIGFDVEQWSWRLIEPKVESYLSRDARDLAESKGRSPELAEAMVDKDVLVYSRAAEDDDSLQFISVRADAQMKPNPPWSLVPETGPERFLTVSGQRAVELGLAQGFASTPEKLATEFGFEISELTVLEPTTTDALVYFLNTWWATFLLVVIGLTALYFELSAPGLGIGGLIAGLCAVLFFWSHILGGTAGMLEIVLFVSGVGFIVAEIFVIPGFGVAGITGLLLLFSSLVLAGQDFVIPQNSRQWNETITQLGVAAGSGAVFLVAALTITKYVGHLPLFNQLILSAEPDRRAGDDEAKDAAPLAQVLQVGVEGVADSMLRPAGRARIEGRVYDVVSDGSFIEVGSRVQVIEVSGSIIKVSEVELSQDEKTVSG